MAGHIEKRNKENNHWTVVIDFGRDPLTGKRQRKKRTIKGTKRDAEKLLRRMEYQAETGRIARAPETQKLSEFLNLWLDNVAKVSLGIRTFERYDELIRGRVIPTLGHIPLTRLQTDHLQQFYASLAKNGSRKDGKTGGLSAQTIVHHHHAIHKALNYAVRIELLARNPASHVTLPEVPEYVPPIYTMEQTLALFEAITESRWQAAIILAATTGMRRGEIMGLRRQDVDREAPAIHVVQTVVNSREHGVFIKQPKTRKGRRRIPITQECLRAIDRQLARIAELRLKAGDSWQNHDLIFCKKDGTPFHPSQFTNDFRNMIRALKLPRTTPHGLRHTHASLLLEQGIMSKIIAERLGHSRTAVTDDIYSHLLPGVQEAAVAKFEESMRKKRLSK